MRYYRESEKRLYQVKQLKRTKEKLFKMFRVQEDNECENERPWVSNIDCYELNENYQASG